MKKLVSITLCLVMALSVSAIASATTITPASSSKTADTTITFQVDPTYTVTIPEYVNLTSGTASGNVTINDTFQIPQGQKIQVKITADTKGGTTPITTAGAKFYATTGVTGETYEMPYTIAATSVNGSGTPVTGIAKTDVSIGDAVAEFYYKQSGGTYTIDYTNVKLDFTVNNSRYAGTFKDQITFTLSVVDQ